MYSAVIDDQRELVTQNLQYFLILDLYKTNVPPTGDTEVLNFGDCHVNHPIQECVTMINHSNKQALRFEWPAAGPHVSFSPQVKHRGNGWSHIYSTHPLCPFHCPFHSIAF